MNINIRSYYSLNDQIDFNINFNNILNSKNEVFRNIKQIGFNISLDSITNFSVFVKYIVNKLYSFFFA